MKNGLFLLLLLTLLIWFVLALLIAFHADGRERSGFVWFAVVFVLGVVGVLIQIDSAYLRLQAEVKR